MANRYFLRSRLPEDKARLIIRCFADDLTETATAEETCLTRKTVNGYFQRIRLVIYNYDRCRLGILVNKLPIDKIYLLTNIKMSDHKYFSKETYSVIAVLLPDNRLVTDVVGATQEGLDLISENLYNSLVDGKISQFDFADYKFNSLPKNSNKRRSRRLFNDCPEKNFHKDTPIFWNLSRKRLKKFHGIEAAKFILHLRETQWRFNNQTVEQMMSTTKSNNLYRKLLKLLRDNPA